MSDVPSASGLPFSARAGRWLLLLGAVLLTGAGLLWWTRARDPIPDEVKTSASIDDPRLTVSTPYRNVRPEVKYVGDQACRDCHPNESENYAQHPMGRALAPVADATPLERHDAAAFNPFSNSGLRYRVERRGSQIFHREEIPDDRGRPVAAIESEVQFAIGSGARARSYAVSHDGYLFQSPLTWFPHGKRWDLSPSYEIRNLHFSRPIAPACLFCHANQVDPVPGTVNRYRNPIFQGYAIGCERCHGPGELHVRRHTKGETVDGLDETIVNPARLEHSLREAVCEQCHLQGEQRILARGRDDFDFRPGLPFHLFLMDFVDARGRDSDFKFVSATEQMRASRCFAESREPKKLGCISCHDPHKVPSAAEKVSHYRGRCLTCHTEKSCSLSPPVRRMQEKEDSCIACHMPRGHSEVNHTTSANHRVLRRPPPPTQASPRRTTVGPGDLVPFHRDLLAPGDEETSRNQGLALMEMLDRKPPESVIRQFAEAALPLLERARVRDPHDHPVVMARADALWALGRQEEAATAYDTVLAENPTLEKALHGAATLALARNRNEDAERIFQRAIQVNPWSSSYHHGLAVAFFRRGERQRSIDACQQALRLEPSNVATRSLLIQCHLAGGWKDRAQAEYETVRMLTPDARRGKLQEWFDEQQRRFLGSGSGNGSR